MKPSLSLIVSVLLLALVPLAPGFPTPIPKPVQSMKAASALVMKRHGKKKMTEHYRKTSFIQSMQYTSHANSVELREMFLEEDKKARKEKGLGWVYEEWGWLVTVVMAHDLSQSITYFVRRSGEVELLWDSI